MRIWDVSPGYLDRQRLLGEHRELHGLHSILVNGKTGYARHPEALRWVGLVPGLCSRHATLVAEMHLRGYADRTPARVEGRVRWPAVFVTPPADQLALLRAKHGSRTAGRIPLPRSAPELWAHHKYSVMARDQEAYRSLGRRVARMRGRGPFEALVEELVALLRRVPPRGALANALAHMWGHVSREAAADDRRVAEASASGLFLKTRELALRVREPYLLSSTALADLAPFVVRRSPC